MTRDPRVTRGLPVRLRVNHGTGTGLGSGTVVRPAEFTTLFRMPPERNPMEQLHLGLAKLKASTLSRVNEIKAVLEHQEPVLDIDIEFIDQGGNHVAEDLLV